MVSPVRVICVAVWGIGWWLVLAHSIGLFNHLSLTEGAVG